jgi:multiple sugar transport system substrate-binding protein
MLEAARQGSRGLRRLFRIMLMACIFMGAFSASGQQPAELLFTFWGSPVERAAVEQMVAAFNAEHPHIRVRAEHVPANYTERISTMVAAGNPPDVAYLGSPQAWPWFEEGVVMDLTEYFEADPEVAERLEETFYRTSDGRTMGTSTAAETVILYYRRDLFDAAGLDYPPSIAEEAWTWDEFVEVAKRLTRDANGNDATSPDFNPNRIETYGIVFPQWWASWLPLIWSNNGRLANDEGTELLLNQPEAVEVLQQMQDLIYVHHVAPTPAEAEAMPAASAMMQAGRVAMEISGHWNVLDYSQLPMDWSVGVLPHFERPVTVLLGAGTVIFSATEHPDEAWEFYKWHNDPEQVDLFRRGLWMPLQMEYYTDPERMSAWLDGEPGVYPPEARDVFVDYTLCCTPHQPLDYWLRNQAQILSEAINPAMELLWTGQATAQEAMDEAVRNAAPLMEGRY